MAEQPVHKGRLLYEGKAKQVFETEDANRVWVEYKDEATAGDGAKRGRITGKGACNNQISALLFEYLMAKGLATHFIRTLSPTAQLVQRVRILPIEVVVRNRAAGSIAERLGFAEGRVFDPPVVDFYYKEDALHDPLVTEDHIRVLDLARPEQIQELRRQALAVNQALTPFFLRRDVDVVDFKLEFGVTQAADELVLADEISPDTCRFWDTQSGRKLDKDRFRRDLGQIEQAYQEILRRVQQREKEQ